MNPNSLEHRLTPAERESFDSLGYLVVENALDKATVSRLLGVVDRIDAREREPDGANKLLSVPDIVREDDAIVDLLDWPTTFPKVWGILGWNIYLYHSHIDVTPPADPESLSWRVAWHQDSMRVNDEIESHPRPRLSLKIGFFLTDLTESNRGNTLVVPGSQSWDDIDCPNDGVSNPEGSQPLCLKPGTAVVLDRRAWHSRSPNLSDVTRKVVWFGYAYRWLRPKDEMTVEHLYPKLDPIRRQLLGDRLSANGVYDPLDGDVPLREWLSEHDPDAAAPSPHGASHSRPPAMVRGKNLGR